MSHDQPPRRTFLAWLVAGLGALFTIVLGAPVVAYVVDPRNRKSAGGAEAGDGYRAVDGVILSDLQKERAVQGTLRAVRRDAWTLHPNDVIGRVWIVLKKDAVPSSFRGTDAALLSVFTTTCPHLGCSVNLNADASTGFTCPCHTARYRLDGVRDDLPNNPAPRDMDALEWKIETDPANPDRQVLLVKFENFKAGQAAKEAV
jgi:Rieske Fe-S protein